MIASSGMLIAHWWHVAVLTRPQTLSQIIFQIALRAGDGNSLTSQVGNELQQQMPTNAFIDFIHK